MSCDCTSECNCDLTVPKGDKGDVGPPSALFLSFIDPTTGGPATITANTYRTVGEFVFDYNTMEVFTMLKACIYMSAGTGSFQIVLKSINAVLYENTNVTATSTFNVETATGLSIIPSADEVIQVQFKSNNGVATCSFSSITFGYE
jgi:hypothetical protein